MSFVAWQYPFFLAGIALTFWIIPRGMRLSLVILASLAFYGFWDVRFCSLLIAAAVSDYLCTLGMADDSPGPRISGVLALLPAAWLVAVTPFKPVPLPDIVAAVAACTAFGGAWLYARGLPVESRRRALLWLAIGVNLGLLVCFKYANWFAGGLQSMLSQLGVNADSVVLDILLPVGISFHTFQSISYAVDVYDRRCEAERSFARVLAMITFFPQLVAGPIERAGEILPQLRFDRKFDWRFLVTALHLLLIGYFLKVFVADNCAVIADYYFRDAHSGTFSRGWALAAIVAYAAQIYGDFVGYSYIARGSAILLGVQLTRNFELPLAARSPGEFWRRWHISLSTWIRDYVFLPLSLWMAAWAQDRGRVVVGRRLQRVIMAAALVVTMLLAGLWHGAAWNFIAFGAFYGILQAVWLLVPGAQAWSASPRLAPRITSHVVTVALVLVAWVIFRSDSVATAASTLRAVVSEGGDARYLPAGVLIWLLVHVLPLIALMLLGHGQREESDVASRPLPVLATAYFAMILLVASSGDAREQFIYFQF